MCRASIGRNGPTALKKEYPQLTILGELWDGKPELVAFFQGGRKQFDGVDTGVDTLFDFPLYYAMRDVFAKRQPMTRLADTIAADTNYVDASHLVTFLGLHDTGRFLSEPGATRAGLKLAFTYLLTARGTPLIYYGDEIGMTGGGDPHNRAGFPGGWPEDKRNAFETSGRTAEEEGIHAHVTKLLKLRRIEKQPEGLLEISRGSSEWASDTPPGHSQRSRPRRGRRASCNMEHSCTPAGVRTLLDWYPGVSLRSTPG
jgi:neopullulanase